MCALIPLENSLFCLFLQSHAQQLLAKHIDTRVHIKMCSLIETYDSSIFCCFGWFCWFGSGFPF